MRHRFLNWALFLAILLSTPGIDALAQTTVTIGTGTSSQTWPIYTYWWFSRDESIYTSSQFSTAGWSGPGLITNVRWNVAATSTYVPGATSTVKIYMENTTATSTTSGGPILPSTGILVYQGAHPQFTSTGWYNFTLTTPFCYDGTNLLIRVERDDTGYSTVGSPSFYYTATANIQHRYDYADGAPPPNWRYSNTSLPNVQLVFGTGTPQSFVSSTTIQPNTNPTGAGQVNQEVIAMQVVTTGCTSPLQVTSITLNTAGTTSASDILNAKVYYTGTSPVFSPINQFGATVSNPNGSFTVTGTQNTAGGTNHFWLAYDISPTAVAGNFVDAQCNSITVSGTPRTPTVQSPAGSRAILSPFSGNYTIDQNGTGARNFTSFTAAINAMMSAGVVGPTNFAVAAGTYNELLNIVAIPGVNASAPVTFDGGTGNAASRIVTYSVPAAYGAVVTLNGADYLRFRNLSITSTNASYGYAMLFTAQADYNEVTNCVLSVPNNTTSSYHIPLVASSTSSYSASGNWANYNIIRDNTLNSGYYGISWFGAGSSSYTSCRDNQFIGNTIQGWYYMGLYGYYHHGSIVHKNVITQRAGGTNGYGIYAYYWGTAPQITSNSIWCNYMTMYTYYFNYYQAISGARAKIINNMLIADGTVYNSNTYGLYPYYVAYTDIAYNSIYTRGSQVSYGIYHQDFGSSTYNVKYANNYVTYEGNSTWYPLYMPTSTSITQCDYNAYHRIGTGTDQYYWNGSIYSSLASLQTSTVGYHDYSKLGNPYFISRTDLHSRSIAGYQAGTPFPGVTDDFDGQTRSATAPCIGADEYPQPPNEYDIAIAKVRLETATNSFAHLEDPATHQVRFTVWNSGLAAGPANLTVNYKVGSMPADASDGVSENFAITWDANNKAVLTFTQPLSGLVAGTNTVYVRHFYAADQGPADNVGFNTHSVFGPKVHGYEDFEDMANGTLPLTYDGNYIPSKWKVIDNNGGASMLPVFGPFNGSMQALTYWPLSPDPADEWVVSPGAFLVAGSSYRIGFEFYNFQGTPVTIECAFGSTADPAAMTTFATFSNVGSTGGLPITAKQLAGGLDPYFNTPNFHQNYYLGIRFVTQGGTPAQFSIDKILLDDNPSPPPKIAYGLPGDPIANFVDDPAVPIILSSTYKTPGLINKTFAVINKINIYGTLGDFLWDVETSTPWLSVTKAIPEPTQQGYNMTPPRPRQFQTFTLTADPTGLAAGVHYGSITMYGILFNNDFPPPSNGLIATNEPFTVPVELRVSLTGTKGGANSMERTLAGPLTVPGSPYHFVDPLSGDPIATLHVTSGQIDQMTIRCFPNQLPQNITRLRYIQRYWQISHTGTGWTADITFPYSDHEAAMVLDRYQLRGVRQPIPLGAWENPIMGTTSVSYPLTNQVRVNNFNPMNIGGNIALAQPYGIFVKDGLASIEAFELEQNYPNPFNPTTSIRFAVAEERAVRIAVYNSLGAEVAVLVDEVLPAGRYESSFDATSLPSGTYVYRMMSGDFVQTRQMTLAK